jgi:hypothetical protein
MDVIKNISEIIDSKPNDLLLEQYLSDVRESLTSTNKQFIAYQFLFLFTLVIYHLVVHEGWKGLSVVGVKISDESLFDKVFLIVPAGIFIILSAVGYLRKLQREVYDYLVISRLKVLGKTGVHELRLPSNYILGLDILRHEGGAIGKLVSNFSSWILSFIFLIGPAIYMLTEAIYNLKQYGYSDTASIFVLIMVTLSFLCGLTIIKISGQVNA